jgi:hypothetical protein
MKKLELKVEVKVNAASCIWALAFALSLFLR